MPCYFPMPARRIHGGGVEMLQRGQTRYFNRDSDPSLLQLPCGQCVGCRLERSRQWAMRCIHEASLHEDNCFITLTYADEHLPTNSSLDYKHFQDFMKRLRKKFRGLKIKFYMAGEYGETTFRPHFHACLFGVDFPDKSYHQLSPSGEKLYRSEILERLWPFGHALIGSVTFESAAYVARYIMKKITGPSADTYYSRIDPSTGEIYQLTPEFNHMSLKPGIGAGWYQKYSSDVYPHDYVVINGAKCKPPKYYDRRFSVDNPDEYAKLLLSREINNAHRLPDRTDARLSVSETVTNARISTLKRTL